MTNNKSDVHPSRPCQFVLGTISYLLHNFMECYPPPSPPPPNGPAFQFFQRMIEEALVEALAQEHFNYIAEGEGVGYSPAAARLRYRTSPSSPWRRRGEKRWRWPWHLLSPKTAISVVTIVAAAVAARHFRDFLVDFTREAFSTTSEGGDGVGGTGVSEVVASAKR